MSSVIADWIVPGTEMCSKKKLSGSFCAARVNEKKNRIVGTINLLTSFNLQGKV